ncbi:MAG: ATP-dependent helicase [Dehalococcoidia bacterium]
MAVSRQWLEALNPAQLGAVTHGDGPLLVVAGAGTGKTRTLAYRVAHLISLGTPPERILLLTFTRRAAEEMLHRAAAAVWQDGISTRVWGGTFHATANRLLRMYGRPAGLSPDFTIMDRADSEDFLNVVRNELDLAQKEKRFPRKSTCMDIYSRRVNSDEELGVILKKHFPWCEAWEEELRTLFRHYVGRKQERDILDYDDLLLYWHEMLKDDSFAVPMSDRFDHILVDEYQDTNRIQAKILEGMRRSNKNITVVGDDAQSIYSFRSATVRNMMDFPAQFPGAKIVTLEQNYRSVKPVLETTNRIISQARQRYSKELWSERTAGQRPQVITCLDESHQDEEVIRRVLEHYEQGIELKRQAVLFRAASNSASLELALIRRNIPFRKYGGLRFLESAHIKDLISILRILENPRDEIAWFRVLQLLSGVGPATAAAAFGHLQENGFYPHSMASFRAPPGARSGLAELVGLIEHLSAAEDSSPAMQVERIGEFYLPLLERNYENPEPRKNDIEHLGQLAARYPTRRQFLADLVLDPPVSTGDFAGPPLLDEDWLVLSTIHSAKGLEWDAVYLIHAADGCLPSDLATGDDDEIEEELRLTYVATTRARDFLYILWPLRFYTRSFVDTHVYAQLCRFFTPEVLGTMDAIAYDAVEHKGEEAIPDMAERDIMDRIRDMWG